VLSFGRFEPRRYNDGGADVLESTIVHDGSEFTLVERIRRDEPIAEAVEVWRPVQAPDRR